MLSGYVATAQDKFKALLADHFGPWLKERGFKRRDATFRRRQAEAWQIVNFQRDKYSDARLLRFTINLGVSLDVLHDDPSWRSRGWPLEAECDFRRWIGELYKGEDHWWSVRRCFRPAERRGTCSLRSTRRSPGSTSGPILALY